VSTLLPQHGLPFLGVGGLLALAVVRFFFKLVVMLAVFALGAVGLFLVFVERWAPIAHTLGIHP
jgi:hypothetical protein